MSESGRSSRVLPSLLSGVLGGLVVLVIGAVLISTDVIDTGETTREVVREGGFSRPAADRPSEARSVSDIYEQEGEGVVFVRSQGVTTSDSPFGFPDEEGGVATGSGFVLDRDGTILTNAHVVEGADEVTVSFEEDAGDAVDAEVKGRDPDTDLAVLKVDPDDVETLRPLPLGDSSKARVGDPVVAIGNPFGYTRTVTSGIVSAVQRRIEAPSRFTIGDVIQTDASINPGNSGGPLLDAQGRVIGINAQIATGGTEGSVGIGFAIPVNTAKKLLPELQKGGEIERGYLGVSTQTVDGRVSEDLNLPVDEGALVQQVVPNGPADRAGLEGGGTPTSEGIAAGGDVIVKLDGEDITSSDDLVAAVEDRRPGEEVEVEYLRGDRRRTVKVKLGERPDTADFGAPDQLP